jgi:hypothetical protein
MVDRSAGRRWVPPAAAAPVGAAGDLIDVLRDRVPIRRRRNAFLGRVVGVTLVSDDWLPLDADWSAAIDVNPVTSISSVHGPETIMEIRVFHLHDAAAAAAAAAKVRAATCPKADFALAIGMATARRGSRTVAIGSTRARLTTATVKRANPEIEASVDYVPGDAKLAFAHGALLISIEALALRSRKANSPTDITAAAEEAARKTATAIVKALPPSATN